MSTNQSERGRSAVVYIRVATAKDHFQAVDIQRHECQRLADKHGLTVIREYVDRAVPAKIKKQAALLDLMQDITLVDDAAFIIVWNYSRLAHDMEQLNLLGSFFHRSSVKVVTLEPHEAADRMLLMQRDDSLDEDLNGEGR